MAIVGLAYTSLRIFFVFLPVLRRQDVAWDMKAARQITIIFLGRLTRMIPTDALDRRSQALETKIAGMDLALSDVAGRWTVRSRVRDTALAGGLALLAIALTWIVGFDRIFTEEIAGDQLDIIITIANVVEMTVFGTALLRTLVAVLWFFPKYRKISLMLRRMSFQALFTLSGVVLLPILSMILRSTDTKRITCAWGYYLDFHSNTPGFLDYFVARNVTCTRCTDWSMYTSASRCREMCTFNTTFPLEYKVLKDAEQVSEDDLSRVYLIPINLLEVYFLAAFVQIQRMVFTRILDIIETLPAPTRFLDAKFGSVLAALETKAAYIFKAVRHKQSLFYFTFTQIKLFVLFFASLFPIFPVDEVKNLSLRLIPWMFFIVSIVISMVQFFGRPYISALHNWINGIGYLVGSIAALVAALVVSGISVATSIGDGLYIMLFVSPILTALIMPFFTRKSMDVLPTSYHLADVCERDKSLTRSYKQKRNKVKHHDEMLAAEEEMEEQKEKKKKKKKKTKGLCSKAAEGEEEELSYDPNYRVQEFSLGSYARIHIQRGILKKAKEVKNAREYWVPLDEIVEKDMVVYVREVFRHANHLLDVFSFNSLTTLLSLSVMFVSMCTGWGLGGATALWKFGSSPELDSLDYYLRCNAIDGVFPEFGTY
jgi:hypothetical protein